MHRLLAGRVAGRADVLAGVAVARLADAQQPGGEQADAVVVQRGEAAVAAVGRQQRRQPSGPLLALPPVGTAPPVTTAPCRPACGLGPARPGLASSAAASALRPPLSRPGHDKFPQDSPLCPVRLCVRGVARGRNGGGITARGTALLRHAAAFVSPEGHSQVERKEMYAAAAGSNPLPVGRWGIALRDARQDGVLADLGDHRLVLLHGEAERITHGLGVCNITIRDQ